jgi:MFS family permease
MVTRPPRLFTGAFVRLALANLFSVSSFTVFFLFPLFITEHGGSKVDIGILMGALSLSSVLCRPWVSQMVDRLGRKKSYTIGTLILTMVSLTYLFIPGDIDRFFFFLFLIRVLHGVGVALCFTSAFTYIADIIPVGRLNEGLGMFGTTGLMGMAIGPLIGETVLSLLGFRATFIAAGLLAFFALILHLPLPESYTPDSATKPQTFFQVLARRKILFVTFLAVLFGFGLAAYGSFASPYAHSLDLPLVSLYFVAYSTAAVLTRIFGGRLADRIGENRVIPPALLINGIGLLLLIWLNGTAMLIISGLVTGCGHGFLFPCLNALAIRDEPVAIRGKINGIFTGGIDTGIFTGSITLGFIGEWAGYEALFLAAGLALMLGLGIFKLTIVSKT